MAQVVFGTSTMKARAERKGRSLEGELRLLIADAARVDRSEFRREAAAFRRKLAGRRHTDSTTLIRADRAR